MPQPVITLDVSTVATGAPEAVALLSGGVFLPGQQHEMFAECRVELRFASASLTFAARVIHVSEQGSAVEFVDFGPVMREKIAGLLQVSQDITSPEDVDDAQNELQARAPAHERLRNLPVVQQIKLALKADTAERIMLERLYGKGVWESLLRNPRITPPEVARIAKMGSLPRPLLEVIVGNGAWLGVPEVRRALLTNPRLSVDVVPRILRLMPKHELKLVPTQTAYASAIREHARRMLKDL
jgi:hypothetical protein